MHKVKNIVIACDYAYIEGGAAKVAIQTAVLLSRNTDCHVFFIGGSGEACRELRNSNVTCVLFRLPDLLQNPSKTDAFIHGIYNRTVYRKATELYRTLNPTETVLHVHTWTKVLTSAVFKAASDCGIRIFLTLHDYFLACPNGGCYNYVQRKICKLQPMSMQCVLCNCDSRNYVYKIWRCLRQARQNRVLRRLDIRYIFISAFQREQLKRRGVSGTREYYVRNPVPVGDRYRVKAEENELFLFAGRVTQEKGADLFCEAVTRAGVKAAVLGDGAMLEDLKKKNPSVFFPGWQSSEQMQEWKKQARCYIFPSVWYEGSPLTVPEMQAFGVPCIVTDCSSAKDTVTDGENGFVVGAEISTLEETVRKMSDDTVVKAMSVATYNRFDEEGCSSETYIKQLTKVYEEG